MDRLLIKGAHVVTPGRDLGVADVVVEGDRVASVGPSTCPRNPSGCEGADILDATGLTLLPGFVDIHSHGRGGADFCDATDEAFETIARGKLKDGVTSFLATGLTQSEETLAELCRCTERYKEKVGRESRSTSDCSSPVCPTCLGVHLEGPFFNPAMAGAQNPAYLREPDADFVLRLNEISKVLKVSLAPELPGAEACIRTLVEAGIVVSLGHSSADYATFERARAAGATHLTHFCNAMMPIHHLRPTMVTGGLLADDVYAEIITDGVHLSDPMIRLIAKAKGPDRLMIVTDAMCAAGEPDGIYSLGGLKVKVEKGKATLADVPYDPKAVVSNVAGSVALFPQCFKRFVAVTGWPLHEAVKAAGYNQLRSLGITDRGEVKVGQIADLVLLDADLNPRHVIARGHPAGGEKPTASLGNACRRMALLAAAAVSMLIGSAAGAPIGDIRAVQLDLARQKETVPFVKDYLRRAKEADFNTIVLYLEDRIKTASYPFPSDAESYSPAEIRDLVGHATALGLDVVPVVSPLGHTERFLRHPELKGLGEQCEGKGRFGPCENPACFCLENPKARAWMERYLTDVAALFPGRNFHFGLDESFNLGFCTRCRPLVAKTGLAAHFIREVRWTHALAERLGKRMWMWDDFFDFFPEAMAEVPKDVMMCCWNYERDVSPTGPRGHFGGRLRRDTLGACERLGLDSLFCVCPWPENVRTFTDYARAHKTSGVLMTQWEMTIDFHGTFWPRIRAAASRWWGADEGLGASFPSLDAGVLDLVRGLLIDLEKLRYRQLTESRILNGVHETSLLNYWQAALETLRALPSKPGVGEIPPDPLSEVGMLEDLAMSLELTLLCERARNVARTLYRPERAAPESVAAKVALGKIRARWLELASRREKMWAAWRPGCPSEKVGKYLAHLPKLVDTLVTRPNEASDTEGLLELVLTTPDTHGVPAWTVEVRETDGAWRPLAHGAWKPLQTDRTFSTVLVPVRFEKPMDELRLAYKGYGAGEICHLSIRNRRGRVVPKAVRATSGSVRDAENLLVDDLRAARLGLPDCTETVLHPARAEEISSVILSMKTSQGN